VHSPLGAQEVFEANYQPILLVAIEKARRKGIVDCREFPSCTLYKPRADNDGVGLKRSPSRSTIGGDRTRGEYIGTAVEPMICGTS